MRALVCLLAVLAVGRSLPALAQENSTPVVDAPLVILHATGVERLIQRFDSMFTSAGRPEVTAQTLDLVKNSLNDLDGMDRTKPFGMMLYLKPGLSGMAGVGYAPVRDLDKFLHTLSMGSGDFQKTEGKPGRHTITNNNGQVYHALNRDGYLFIVSDADADELDRNFPAPEKMVSRLNSRHDLAASLMIKNVPPATRQIFVTFLQTQAMAEMQQKDDEPEAAYRVRKANGENVLELIEKIVTKGEELTLGGRIDEKTGQGEIDLEVAGSPDSQLAKFFQDMTGRRSLFANILKQPSMMTMAMSWQLDEKQRKAFTALMEFGPEEADRFAAREGVEGAKAILEPLAQTLLRSSEAGHLDGFMQLAGEGEGGHALLAGVRITDGANFPKQLQEALKFAQAKFSSNDQVAAMELDVEQIDNFPVHRLAITPPDRPGKWMFGEGSHLYVFASTQALWLAFGGDEAMATLKASVEAAKKPAAPGDERQPRVPFVFQTRAQRWVTVRAESGAEEPPADANPRRPQRNALARANAARFREQVNESFDDQNDGLRIEVRPTDAGARFHMEFQRGWVGLLGRMIATQIDRSTESRAEPTTVAPTPIEQP